MPRPVSAGILTILGGFFVLLGGLLFALLGVVFAFLGLVSGVFFLGLGVGFLIIVFGILILAVPPGHTIFGIVTVLLALLSIPVAFGGLVIGFLLTLLGGILAITWKRPVERIITVEARTLPPPPG